MALFGGLFNSKSSSSTTSNTTNETNTITPTDYSTGDGTRLTLANADGQFTTGDISVLDGGAIMEAFDFAEKQGSQALLIASNAANNAFDVARNVSENETDKATEQLTRIGLIVGATVVLALFTMRGN